tara:strand:+ start:1149 stop:1727 length:579 start_codon:yes stop_codon:yes gene_type:complete
MNQIKLNINTELTNINNSLNFFSDQNIKIFRKLIKESQSKIKKNKIIFCGNGGSASHAQHLACELVVRYKVNRTAISALSLTTDTSNLTAIGNDYNFDYIFSRQLEAVGNKGDICIFLTTSGQSKNLLNAAKVAKKKKISCYSFSGKGGGKLKKMIRDNIIIDSDITSVVQSCHLILGHIYCNELENYICKK